jgi:hypothetical protein
MRYLTTSLLLLSFFAFSSFNAGKGKWLDLFDGQSFDGWAVGKNAASFTIENEAIKVNGNTGHLYYVAEKGADNFRNFEFKAMVMTKPGSNSGIYFHTKYQEGGWPEKGYEVQINNSHTDWRRTGSLWAIQDVKETYVKDDEWFTIHIVVKGKHVTVSLNNRKVVDYTEPENVQREEGMKQRLISSGTFALQAHDPKSTVYFKNISVRALPD